MTWPMEVLILRFDPEVSKNSKSFRISILSVKTMQTASLKFWVKLRLRMSKYLDLQTSYWGALL